jgi:hypothetical protein
MHRQLAGWLMQRNIGRGSSVKELRLNRFNANWPDCLEGNFVAPFGEFDQHLLFVQQLIDAGANGGFFQLQGFGYLSDAPIATLGNDVTENLVALLRSLTGTDMLVVTLDRCFCLSN